MNCLFLYHPRSGKGKVAKRIGYIERTLRAHFDHVDIVATESGEDMTAHARDGAGMYDVILFSGGDGTFNRVLQGIGERDVQLGYLPGGTTNDVARSLGIPRSVKGALKVILAGHEARLDVMRINGTRYAMYNVAAGAFTRATYTTSSSLKKRLGIFAYAVEVLRHEMKFRVFPLNVTGGEEPLISHAVLVLTMNGRSVAGMPINGRGSMADGQIEMAVIRQKEHPGFFARMGAYFSLIMLFLFHGRLWKRRITLLRGSAFSIRTEGDLVWDLDGEEGMRGNIEIELLPRRMKLFVPAKKKI